MISLFRSSDGAYEMAKVSHNIIGFRNAADVYFAIIRFIYRYFVNQFI